MASATDAWLACADYARVRAVLGLARSHLAEVLSAIEFLDDVALASVLERERDLADPLEASVEDAAPFRVLVETSGSDEAHDAEKVERFLEAAAESGAVLDGVIAPTASKARDIWRLREGISDSMTAAGFVYKYDVSLPPAVLYDLVDDARHRFQALGLQDSLNVAGYGRPRGQNKTKQNKTRARRRVSRP